MCLIIPFCPLRRRSDLLSLWLDCFSACTIPAVLLVFGLAFLKTSNVVRRVYNIQSMGPIARQVIRLIGRLDYTLICKTNAQRPCKYE